MVPRHPAAGGQDHEEAECEGVAAGQAAHQRSVGQTEANGCTPGEAAAALEKAEELVAKYELDLGAFRWPPRPSKLPRAVNSGRVRGIGKLAERLIVERPDWPYRRVAEEVNGRIEGVKASETSVRWYATR